MKDYIYEYYNITFVIHVLFTHQYVFASFSPVLQWNWVKVSWSYSHIIICVCVCVCVRGWTCVVSWNVTPCDCATPALALSLATVDQLPIAPTVYKVFNLICYKNMWTSHTVNVTVISSHVTHGHTVMCCMEPFQLQWKSRVGRKEGDHATNWGGNLILLTT